MATKMVPFFTMLPAGTRKEIRRRKFKHDVAQWVVIKDAIDRTKGRK